MLKYLSIRKSFNRFNRYYNQFHSFIYKRFFYDTHTIIEIEDRKFEELGWDVNRSNIRLNAILQKKYGRNFDRELDSIHWLIFSALSMKKHYKKILDIGTYDGKFTNILGKLFPDSEITTVDLPYNDPLLTSFYDRYNPALLSKYMENQSKNTNLPNIRVIKSNTFFLLNELKENEKFDLIWVDGGHLYPDIAWDLCNAYFLLNKGGMLLCDDVIMSDKYYKGKYVSTESWEVLKYLEIRVNSEVVYFLKRSKPELHAHVHTRKYVAMLKK